MDALQYARYKQPTGGISISWIVDLSKEVLPEKPPSTSSQRDFMPFPSPEPGRKHSGQNQYSQLGMERCQQSCAIRVPKHLSGTEDM